MAINYHSQDKYAFLFTGPTVDRFLKDLENVFQVLTEYYQYPPANITIVHGSTPAVMPSFAGATVIDISGAADPATELANRLATFATAAFGPDPDQADAPR